ncbi:MAG: RNA-binding S4 domain-containing protein [Halofilum sp. (in: g-proteobacteria)]|nr:RNA-binding S4 domain-containing protein [Halofilum sp. (in: g-proteobacteria)]
MAADEAPPATGLTREGAQRVDRWLWCARFFKTRSLARQAVSGGRVEINAHTARPAKSVRVGDRVSVATSAARFEVRVEALNEQRRPAPEARQLYTETPESVEARQRAAEERRQRRAAVQFDRARPDRRARRAWIRFRRGED